MTAGVLALLGFGILALPPGSSGVARRLRRLPGRSPTRPKSPLPVLTWSRGRVMTAAAAAVGGPALGITGAFTAVALAALAAAGVAVGSAVINGRRQRRRDAAGLEVVAALAAELRAGATPTGALAAVGAAGTSAVHTQLQTAARAGLLGADVTHVLGADAVSRGPLGRLRAGWDLSAHTGCSLAVVLDGVEQELRSAASQRRLAAELLAGPRATAALLAGLPVLGLIMGTALGAHPWSVLTGTAVGKVALAVGVGLDLLGLGWTARLTRGAEPQ